MDNNPREEFALEIYNDKGFVKQIDVFDSAEKAQESAVKHDEPLQENEIFSITRIEYDDENETEMTPHYIDVHQIKSEEVAVMAISFF